PVVVVLLGLLGFGLWKFVFNKKAEPVPVAVDNTGADQTPADPDTTTPAEWLARFFGSDTCTVKTTCGDTADPDRDGFTNKEEYDQGTDPNNPDSDSDGIADGDEFHIFGSDPLISRTYRDGQFNDADFVKGGFDIKTNIKYNDTQLADIKSKVQTNGLHQPTLTTIGEVALSLYAFKDPNSSSLESMGIDTSPQAKLDRDTQRQSTIKKIGGALLKYKADKKTYPKNADFTSMSEAIAGYNTVATNYNDPINKEKYVYGYEPVNNALDFTLTYFSETQNQLIKYSAKDAQDTATKESGQVNDQQRITDLENIKSALLVYSSANTDSKSAQVYVFPTPEQYPFALIPKYLTALPKDPTGADYQYSTAAPYDSFTLKATFQSPSSGVTGYVCNQEGCKNY
ncbi:MAG TPA: hypothetical protein VHQ41_02450, partial [Patescibacteria group bacterium]|nr:hypothetical protein [Patescibacteria group bacterium]